MEFPHIARWLPAMADSYGSLTSRHSRRMGSDFPTRRSLRRSLWLVLPQSSSSARDFMKANFRKSDLTPDVEARVRAQETAGHLVFDSAVAEVKGP